MTAYNQTTNAISHQPGIELTPDPIGHYKHFRRFGPFAQYLEPKGYQPKKYLFGFPYDWSLYYPGVTGIFAQLKTFIEKIKSDTGQKVVLMGYSMGTHVIRLLYTNYTTTKWIQDNIDSFVFLVPALFGCFQPYLKAFEGKLWYLPDTEMTVKTARRMASYHLLMNNYYVSGNFSIIRNASNFIDASEFFEYIEQNKLFDRESIKIAKLVEPSLKEKPVQPPVRTFVVFNNAINTPVALDVSKNYSLIFLPGDGRCQDQGPLYMCNNWLNIKCLNLNSKGPQYGHSPMICTPKVHQEVYNFIYESNNKFPGFAKSIVIFYTLCVLFIFIFLVIIAIRLKPR